MFPIKPESNALCRPYRSLIHEL